MRFAKYHGLGNDFLVVDLRSVSAADAAKVQDPSTVIALCDRQFGVGADGVLAVLPSLVAGDDARMRVLNSDGSEAEMCGNGLRCVVKELRDRGGIAKDQMAIDTGAGRLVCEVGDDGHVTVSMGAPRLLRSEIPMVGPLGERCIDQPIDVPGQPTRTITCVSMGNPHAITFVSSAEEARHLAETVGPAIERHAYFPQRTNAEFAFVKSPLEIDLVVWERGAGLTLACGTGACATVVAAILTGRCEEGPAVKVNLPGGALKIRVMPELSNVKMYGPAVHVYDGELDLAKLSARPR
ncbi:MAG: diaminopimelate epimerase [Myxococcales bacterium]|nr:diaminopimelate epimerase [Myxococcales bacterium]